MVPLVGFGPNTAPPSETTPFVSTNIPSVDPFNIFLGDSSLGGTGCGTTSMRSPQMIDLRNVQASWKETGVGLLNPQLQVIESCLEMRHPLLLPSSGSEEPTQSDAVSL
jgi:hypothetical protein